MTRVFAGAVKNTKNATANSCLNPAFFPLLSGLLQGLSFPPLNASSLAWIFLIPLLVFNDFKSPFRREWINRFSWGLVSGFSANLLIFFWIWDTFQAAHIGFLTTFNSWVFLSILMGTYSAVFLCLYAYLPETFLRPFIAGALWVSLDFIKSVILTGLPWALMAHTQVNFLSMIQISSVTGASGVTFLLIAFNSGVAESIKEWKAQKFLKHLKSPLAWMKYLLIFIPISFVFFWGNKRLSRMETAAPAFHVAILQGNINQYEKWDKNHIQHIKTRYEELLETALQHAPDLILWPESAVPGWIPNNLELNRWLKELIRKSGVHHIVGAVTERGGKEFNSAFFFNPKGDILGVYDKQHLVPFGEYIPFGGILKRWIPYLGELGVFDKGSSDHQFILKGCGSLKECIFSPNICYEAIFANQIRKSVQRNTTAIVNLTNDGWYLKTGAPAQHFAANVFRAVENGLPVIRAANTGISAVIDGFGRQIKTELMTADVLIAGVASENNSATIYNSWGLWFEWICLICCLVVFMAGGMKSCFHSESGSIHL